MPTSAESWTLTHDIGLVYLALAHGTDTELSDSELAVMIDELRRWRPSINEMEAKEMILECLAIYLSDDRDKELKRAIISIRNDTDSNKKVAVLNDMVHLAEADGIVLFTEKQLVKSLSKIWDVDVHSSELLEKFLA